jgi:hypothetical protein
MAHQQDFVRKCRQAAYGPDPFSAQMPLGNLLITLLDKLIFFRKHFVDGWHQPIEVAFRNLEQFVCL